MTPNARVREAMVLILPLTLAACSSVQVMHGFDTWEASGVHKVPIEFRVQGSRTANRDTAGRTAVSVLGVIGEFILFGPPLIPILPTASAFKYPTPPPVASIVFYFEEMPSGATLDVSYASVQTDGGGVAALETVNACDEAKIDDFVVSLPVTPCSVHLGFEGAFDGEVLIVVPPRLVVRQQHHVADSFEVRRTVRTRYHGLWLTM